MPRGVFVVVTGVEDVDRRLKALEPRVQKRVLRQAMREAMRLVQAEAKANAPDPATSRYATGATKRAIKVRALKSRKRGRLGIEVRVGPGDYKGDTYYAAFLEYGTSRMAARPFMTPAYAAAGPAARDAAMRRIRDGIEAEVRKLARG